MASFEWATAARVVFGAGTSGQAPALIRDLGAKRVLLVTGAHPERAAALHEDLARGGIDVAVLRVAGEPTVDVARDGMALALAERRDAVVAFGGGSAIDAGKAIAVLAANGGDPLDYLEVIGRGKALSRGSLPFIALPSTAGTGSEVTRNAVLADPAARVKASLRSPHMLPKAAIVDPELLAGAPPAVIASSGLDALSQNIEPYLSNRANPLSDVLAREGMRRSASALRRVFDGQGSAADREDLALASLCGGLCLANSGLGAVHGFAAPVGGMFAAPHGAVCAALLGPVLEVNRRALSARAPGHPAGDRLREIAVILTGRAHASAEDGIAWIRELCEALGVAGLSRYGMTARDIPALVEKARAASSMKGNPILLTDEELADIALRAL